MRIAADSVVILSSEMSAHYDIIGESSCFLDFFVETYQIRFVFWFSNLGIGNIVNDLFP